MSARRTIWEMVDEHRLRRAWMLTYFVGLWTLFLCVPLYLLGLSTRLVVLLASGSFVSLQGLLPSRDFAVLSWATAIVSATVLGLLYLALVLRRGEWQFLSGLGAHRVTSEQYPGMFSALNDMTLAAGLPFTPAIWVLPDESGVNAIVLGSSPQSAAVAVTAGFATRAEQRLQRAVFASLVSRFRDGGVSWTSLLFMLLKPIRTALGSRRGWDARPIGFVVGLSVFGAALLYARFAMFRSAGPDTGITLSGLGWEWIVASLALALGCLWAVSVALDLSHRAAYTSLARNADAEGVLLLRNPDELLGALRAVLLEDTRLAGGRGLSYLSFVDCTRDPRLNVTSDSEDQRIVALEELAFPSGGRGVSPLHIDPRPDGLRSYRSRGGK